MIYVRAIQIVLVVLVTLTQQIQIVLAIQHCYVVQIKLGEKTTYIANAIIRKNAAMVKLGYKIKFVHVIQQNTAVTKTLFIPIRNIVHVIKMSIKITAAKKEPYGRTQIMLVELAV